MDLAGVPVIEVDEAICDMHLRFPTEHIHGRRPPRTYLCAHHIAAMREMIERINKEKEQGRAN